MNEHGASLLKNSSEQSVVEKLRALLIFGSNDRRYKDIYDIYYFMNSLNKEKLLRYIDILIFQDNLMRENTMSDIIKRLDSVLSDKSFLKRISTSRQRWIDETIETIASKIINFFKQL